MNTLYFVTLYNSRRNEFARYLLTQPGPTSVDQLTDAGTAAQLVNDGDWTVRYVSAVCSTPDELFREV